MGTLPITPDFDVWPIINKIKGVSFTDEAVTIAWDDGKHCEYSKFLLRENSPEPETLHPLSRETLLGPGDISEDLRPQEAHVDEAGALVVTWANDGYVSRFHPGWLRAHAWFGGSEVEDTRVLWTADELPEPPTFHGPTVLADRQAMLAWLEAVRDYGVARLEGLPQQDGLLEKLVMEIGTVRETNFGRSYTLAIKDDPDSNAYTSAWLPQHIDLPTRECPIGMQFLYCRSNTTSGGEGVYCDGYRIAEDMRTEEPEHFQSLIEDVWEYNNRSKTTSYRASGPVVDLDAAGAISAIRYNTWLRAPMVAPLEIQERAYRAVRAYAARTEDPKYQMVFSYRAGDLLAFDNRRALHGRKGYDAKGGSRFIEGIYSDRDDLLSKIRVLKRELAGQMQEAAE